MVEIIIDTMCGDIPNKNITPSKRTFSCVLTVKVKICHEK